ncbi:hypothetical protein EDD15DRAFT_2191428 [Pisolithus albus]|nr:hypothetical protein EDD15DRAFT_2191428 [Pisolithus albus]
MSHNWARDEFNDDWPPEAEQMMLNLVNVPREHQPHACGWVVGGEACTDVLFPREFPGHLREHGVIGDDNARMSCCWSKRVAPRSGGASGIEDRMPRLRADFYTQDHFEQSPKESTPLTGMCIDWYWYSNLSVVACHNVNIYNYQTCITLDLSNPGVQAKIELIGRLPTLRINHLLNELLPQSFELVAHALILRRQFAVKPDHKKRLACVTPTTGGEVNRPWDLSTTSRRHSFAPDNWTQFEWRAVYNGLVTFWFLLLTSANISDTVDITYVGSVRTQQFVSLAYNADIDTFELDSDSIHRPLLEKFVATHRGTHHRDSITRNVIQGGVTLVTWQFAGRTIGIHGYESFPFGIVWCSPSGSTVKPVFLLANWESYARLESLTICGLGSDDPNFLDHFDSWFETRSIMRRPVLRVGFCGLKRRWPISWLCERLRHQRNGQRYQVVTDGNRRIVRHQVEVATAVWCVPFAFPMFKLSGVKSTNSVSCLSGHDGLKNDERMGNTSLCYWPPSKYDVGIEIFILIAFQKETV